MHRKTDIDTDTARRLPSLRFRAAFICHELDKHLLASRRVDATIIERLRRRYEIRGDRTMPRHQRRDKTVFDGEWVSVRGMLNRYFAVQQPCTICGKWMCEPVWYSLKSREVRCKHCFTPPALLQ